MEKESKREQLLSLLGEMPERHRVEAYTLKIEERESYLVETLILSIHGVEEVPAYFVKPKDTVKKRPVVLFQHSHGGNYVDGKEELLKGLIICKRLHTQKNSLQRAIVCWRLIMRDLVKEGEEQKVKFSKKCC